jgi:mannitol/fructose-specific phosphotransferase system IIA component (Ntr-type)
MTLAKLLSPGVILPDLQATERWQAITEIVDFLVAGGSLAPGDREEVLAALRQREETMSTGIGFGIAIPHASSDCVSEVLTAFARSAKGIEFDSLDNELVHFIVLFIVPKNQFQAHLRTLAAIAKFLNDRVVREELAAAEGTDGILEVFRRHSPKNG